MSAEDGRVVTTTRVERGLTAEEAGAEQAEPDADDLDGWLERFRGQVTKVVVKRRPGPGRTLAYLTTHHGADLTLEQLRADFGGGQFQLSLMNGSGYLKAVTLDIEGPPKQEDPPAAPAAPVAHAPQSGGEALQQAVQIATMMQTAQSALLAPLLEALTAQREVREGPTAADLMNALLQGIELGKEGARDGDGYGHVVRELGVPLLGLLGRGGPLTPGAAPAAPGGALPAPGAPGAPPAGPAAPSGGAPPPGGPSELPGWAQMLRPHVPNLVTLAKLRADPEYWAGQTEGQLDDDQAELLVDQLVRGDAFLEDLERHFPELALYRRWTERFAAHLVELLTPDTPEAA